MWLTEQRYGFKTLSHTSDFYYQQRYNSFDNSDAQTVMQELKQAYQNDGSSIEALLVQFGLFHRSEAPLIQLSSGEHKRFQLIKAFVSRPQILVLDSPFIGLDKEARKHLHTAINEASTRGTKIILITDAHQIPDCITHVAALQDGKLQSFLPKEEFGQEEISINAHHQPQSLYSLPLSESKAQYEYIINLRDVSVRYGNKTIFQNINWQIKPGDKWLLKGGNGAGKSTLLSLINGDNPQAYNNEIYLFDKKRGSGESIWDIKQKTGFVSPELHAFYNKSTTCFNTIASGFFDTVGLFKKLSEQQKAQVESWIDFLYLAEVQNKPLANLSFGMQRLVLLARALVKNPPLLILDEPCQGLDDEQKDAFVSLVNNICEQFDKTLIYVSHYDSEVPDCIEQVMELKSGEATISLQKRKRLDFAK